MQAHESMSDLMWPFHRHDWQEVGRQFAEEGLLGRGEGTRDITIITYRCTCLKHRQETLMGRVS